MLQIIAINVISCVCRVSTGNIDVCAAASEQEDSSRETGEQLSSDQFFCKNSCQHRFKLC